MLPGMTVMKFNEETPFRFTHDDEGLKLALRVAINSNWSVILTPDDLDRIPRKWLLEMLRLNEEITRQYNIAKASIPES